MQRCSQCCWNWPKTPLTLYFLASWASSVTTSQELLQSPLAPMQQNKPICNLKATWSEASECRREPPLRFSKEMLAHLTIRKNVLTVTQRNPKEVPFGGRQGHVIRNQNRHTNRIPVRIPSRDRKRRENDLWMRTTRGSSVASHESSTLKNC